MEQDAQLRRVEKVLATLWRDRLIAAKRVATPEVFVARCFRAARLWGHVDLFNDVPLLPEGVLQRVVGYPRRARTAAGFPGAVPAAACPE